MNRDAKLSELTRLRSKTDDELESLVKYTSLTSHQHQLRNPPWKLPQTRPNAATVNKILGESKILWNITWINWFFSEQSLKIQSSTIPSLTNTFYSQTKFIVSNACQNISILLRFYLKSLGVESQVICGVYHIASHELTAPHVFLKIGGHVIDNTYIHSDTEKSAQGNLDAFIEEISPTLRTWKLCRGES